MSQRTTPPLVTVVCVLLYFGGGVTAYNALLGYRSTGSALSASLPLGAQVVYGLFLIGVGVALHRRLRWAWWTLTIVCCLSLLLAAVTVGVVGPAALTRAAGPAIYLAFLTRPSVRAWYRPDPPPALPQPETPA